MEGAILANLALGNCLDLPKLASNVSTLETEDSFNASTSSTLERDVKLHSTVSWSMIQLSFFDLPTHTCSWGSHPEQLGKSQTCKTSNCKSEIRSSAMTDTREIIWSYEGISGCTMYHFKTWKALCGRPLSWPGCHCRNCSPLLWKRVDPARAAATGKIWQNPSILDSACTKETPIPIKVFGFTMPGMLFPCSKQVRAVASECQSLVEVFTKQWNLSRGNFMTTITTRST